MQKKMIKIEMGIAEDIQKVIGDSNSAISDLGAKLSAMERADQGFKQVAQAADKAQADADKSVSAAVKLQTKIGTVLEKAEKAARDLGVPASSVAGYNEADKIYNDIETRIKEVNGFDFPIAKQSARAF